MSGPALVPRWDVAIIPCTKSKNPLGTTARTLYKSAGFTLMMNHAMQRADSVLIMSSKYGLLQPSDPVEMYEAYLPDLSPEDRAVLLCKLTKQIDDHHLTKHPRVLSYLPRAYYEALAEACPALAHSIYRPYRSLPMMALFAVLRNETENYGSKPARR